MSLRALSSSARAAFLTPRRYQADSGVSAWGQQLHPPEAQIKLECRLMEQTAHRIARRAYTGGRHRAHGPIPPARAGILWLVLISGLGVGVLLVFLSGLSGTEQQKDPVVPVSPIGLPRGTASLGSPEQLPVVATASRTAESEASVSASPTPTPSPSATPAVTASPSPSQSPTPHATAQPVLLGPDNGGELESMVQRYCDRHVSQSSSAAARSDGRWECRRFLTSPRIANMDTACRDWYGGDAYAQNTTGGAYGWRCYRIQPL